MTFIMQKEGSFTLEVMEKNSCLGVYWLEMTEGKKNLCALDSLLPVCDLI